MSIQFCTFQVDGQLFGVEVDRVAEVLKHHELTPVPRSHASLTGLMNLRGQIVAAVDLRTVLGLGPLEGGHSLNLVIRNRDEFVSLLVDAIDDVIDVEESWFEVTPGAVAADVRRVLLGTYKLDDRILLALDVDSALDAGLGVAV